MNRRTALLPALGALALLCLAGCSATPGETGASASASRIPVVASTDVWGDIASTVGGDHVSVTSIIHNPDQDPHEFEASARTQLKLAQARVVIENGGGYDDFMPRMLTASGNTTAHTIDAVHLAGPRAHRDGELNEHVWYDFPTVEKVIDRIRADLTAIQPDHRADFAANAAKLTTSIHALEHREATIKKDHAGTGAAITEPVPLDMLDAMGLVDKTPAAFSKAIEDDTDVAPSVLNDTLKLFSGHRVALLAYNAQTTGPQTTAVLHAAEKASIPVVPVTETLPAGHTYLTWMRENIDTIDHALNR